MNILIAGGSGFLGKALSQSFLADQDRVWVLSRQKNPKLPRGIQALYWDGRSNAGWGQLVEEMDVVIHMAGKTLASWPWTERKKQAFLSSRVLPGKALAAAIENANHRPRVFVQISGVNYYGLRGVIADESTPSGKDFLARLAVEWENSTKRVEELGVRRIIARCAVVLAKGAGMLPLMALPVHLFVAGPIAGGRHGMAWIHILDWVKALRFLIDRETAQGPFNLISPAPTSNAGFYRSLAEVFHRPYWFPTPAFLLKAVLGEMSVMIVEGRFVKPQRLTDLGFQFKFERADQALINLFG